LRKFIRSTTFLPKLNALVAWEIFCEALNLVREKERKSNVGRHAFDVRLMFKILVLKSIYNLSDDQTELQIRGRISFRDFLGLTIADTVPGVKTIWDFDEQLKNLELEQSKRSERNGNKDDLGFQISGFFVRIRPVAFGNSKKIAIFRRTGPRDGQRAALAEKTRHWATWRPM